MERPRARESRRIRVVDGQVRAHRQLAQAVAVEVAQGRQRVAELIVIIQDAGEAALGVADLLVGRDRVLFQKSA